MNLSYFTNSRKFETWKLVFVLMFISMSVLGQKSNFSASKIYANTEIVNSSIVKSFSDPEILVPNHVSLNAKTFVKLKVDSQKAPFTWSRSEINITMKPFLPNGTEDSATANHITKTLQVEYNPNGNSSNYIDLSTYELLNRYGVRVIVNSVKTTNLLNGSINTTSLNSNVSLEIGFEAERYYQVTQQLPVLDTEFQYDENGQPVTLQLSWPALKGALEYELEWTWVDNYSTVASASLLPNQVKFSTRDFELNNTRVRTPELGYQIPLVYSSGFLIYRIRAVGRFIDLNDVNKPFYGPWSSGVGTKNNVGDWSNSFVTIGEHDKIKNWQFQATYAEKGKKKEVVSYFDGSLRNRQTVTKVNSDNRAVVGEVIYDAQGRAAIEVLPVPIDKNYIKYFKELNRNMAEEPFSHLDFDWQDSNINSCVSTISGMSTKYGSSNYYSADNELFSQFKNYIPDAKTYPFSQIEYTPDNTGRVVRKGGVGLTHQLDNGHEMQYFYSTPNQEELNRLFGYQVGYATHYKKNTVVDPNGQVSVSYIDPQGKTIATALAGGQPTETISGSQVNLLDPLQDTTDATLHKKMTIDLLNKVNEGDFNTPLDNNELSSSYNFSNNKDILTLSKQVGVAGNNIQHNFTYSILNKSVFEPTKNDVNGECPDQYAFVYDLSISLKDKCGIELINSPIIQNFIIGKEATGEDAQTISESVPVKPDPITLNTGNYSLLKELKVNKEVLETYADQYMSKFTDKKSKCFIQPNVFAPKVNIDCETSCLDCTTNVGTQSNYVLKQLKGIYNIPATSNIITIDPTTFALTIGTVPANSTINFGQQISLLEANGFVEKFKKEWLPLKAACDYICGITFASSCGTNEKILLNDVSPKGQYFLINYPTEANPNPVQNVASLYNLSNQLIYQNQSDNVNWKNPASPYLNELGQPALVEVALVDATANTYSPAVDLGAPIVTDANGLKFVDPKYLANADDFVNKWKDSWAKSLLPYHPEYCYLEYSRKVCEITKNIDVKTYGGSNNATVISTVLNKPLTSDEYDGYLNYLDTYQKAEDAGFINDIVTSNYLTSASSIPLYANDPYFSQQFTGFENATLFAQRKDIIEKALTDHYEFNLINGNPAKLFQVAMQTVRCNAVEPCIFPTTSNFNDWTEAERDRLWNTYKSFYISLKSKIKHVFINTYAKSNGCYNGCIGVNQNAAITDVLKNYQPQVDAIIAATTTYPTPFCDNVNAYIYKGKEKRFIPIDYSYNSSIDQNEAIAQLTSQGNYAFYTQTGNCPMTNDLGIFIKGFFDDVNLSTTTISFNNVTRPIGQGTTAKLFSQLTGQAMPYSSSVPPSITTNLNGDTMIFSFGQNLIMGTQNQLEFTLPASSGLSWNNYALFGASKWRIIGLGQVYYDQAVSNLTPGNLSFAYQVVAKVQVNNPSGSGYTIKEVVFSGKTIAKIGECYIQGSGQDNEIGESIQTALGGKCCSEKDYVAESLKDLIVHLQNIGQINSNYDISNDPVFTSGFLYTFLNIIPSDVVRTEFYPGSFRLFVNDQNVIYILYYLGNNMSSPLIIPDFSIGTLENLTIGNILYEQSVPYNGESVANEVYLSFMTPSGPVSGYSAICKGTTQLRKDNLFTCDSPCGDYDRDGNGIGDLCDGENNSCVMDGSQKQIFETGLKDVLNDFISNHTIDSNGNYTVLNTLSSSNPVISNFIQTCNLDQRYLSLRNYAISNVGEYNYPASLLAYNIKRIGHGLFVNFNDNVYNGQYENLSSVIINPAASSGFSLGLDTMSHINFITLVGDYNGAIINYTDNQGVTIQKDISIEFGTTRNLIPTSIPGQIQMVVAYPCNFMNQSGVNSKGVVKNNIKLSSLSKGGGPVGPALSCTPCIPPTIAPIACDDAAYGAYLGIFKFDENGHSTIIENVTTENIIQQDRFCASSLQYVVASYQYYIGALSISSTFDPNYLTILQFGDTNLNYGYHQINEAIDEYVSYNSGFEPVIIGETEDITPRLYWQEYINTVFFENMNGCPPVPMPVYSLPLPEIKSPCKEWGTNISEAYALDSYNAYLYQLRQEFISDYIKAAMENVSEEFNLTYDDKEYQYTLYYYDQAGNLIQTVAPEGVKRLKDIPAVATPPSPAISMKQINNAINSLRANSPATDITFSGTIPVLPLHTYKTEYKYNTLNQLVWQSTPDGGVTRFAYDKLGRIIASQNAKQANTSIEPNISRFSYTEYDILGRITEAGEIHIPLSAGFTINDQGKLLQGTTSLDKFIGSYTRTEVTRTLYSEDPIVENTTPPVFASSLFTTNAISGYNPSHNNRNRVTAVFYHDTYTSKFIFDNAIFYNYDIHGNVKEMVSYNSYLKGLGCSNTTVIDPTTGQKNDCEKHLKRVVYDYDLISGNVNTVTFQPNKIDKFIHKYAYDADNRIVNVETSPDGINWERDAKYSYYPHGPLARVVLGDKKVQGIDYAYTLQGWLKIVNGENITLPDFDLGGDGYISPHPLFEQTKTKDAFGYSLSYFDKDYKAIGGDAEDESFSPLMFSRNNTVAGTIKNLYNGNIRQMVTAIKTNPTTYLPVQKNNYTYDQLNRIKGMTSSSIEPDTSESGIASSSNSYSSTYSYDRNGNLQTMTNTAPGVYGGVTNPLMDNFSYKYAAGNNRLNKVFDSADDLFTTTGIDIKKNINQLPGYLQNDTSTHNYIYDEIGQLIEDKSEGLKIYWRVDGKVKNVIKTVGGISQNIVFEYDGLGNRIAKKVIENNNDPINIKTSYYSRDAQGNVLAVYDLEEHKVAAAWNKDLVLKEHHIFGSSRLGLESKSLLVYKMINGTGKTTTKFKSEPVLVADADLAKTPNVTLNSFIPTRNYSLHFDNNTVATWPMLAAGESPLADAELNKFTFNTKISLTNGSVLNNGSVYQIGKIIYQGTNNVTNSNPEDIIGLAEASNLYYMPCLLVTPNVDFVPSGTEISISRQKNCQPILVDSKQANTNELKTLDNCNDNCPSEVEGFIWDVFQPAQNGYMEFTPNVSTNFTNNPVNTTVTTELEIGGIKYGLKTVNVSDTVKNLYMTKTGNTDVLLTSALAPNQPLRIEKEVDPVTGNQSIKYTYTPLGLPAVTTASVSTGNNSSVTNFVVKFSTIKGGINNLKIQKVGSTITTITNELSFSLRKEFDEFIPVFKLTEYRTPQGGNTTKRDFEMTSQNSVTEQQLRESGVQIDFNLDFTDQTVSKLSVNQIDTIFTDPILDNYGPGTVPTNIVNQLGTSTGVNNPQFDLCYLDYGFSKVDVANSAISHSFSFDDVTSYTQTDNPPHANVSGIEMAVTPNVIRLLGVCLDDLDQDGVYDIFEDVNGNGDLADDDTDGDGYPNYNDSDDDGDGILTKHEWANAFGDTNPNPAPFSNGNPSINTNSYSSYSAENPNRALNDAPNYLDVDDDGDGYATWETFEGGPGTLNYVTPGLPYTQNSDSDAPVDYLDYSSQLYQPTLAFSFNNYLNVVGDKRYELSNHLGNVLVVINDKKLPTLSGKGGTLLYFDPDVISYSDYYPFGMLVPNRHGSSASYRYGFQGQEKDDELKGEGNSLNYEFRMHDPRVGRFFTIDPLFKSYAHLSPYQFADNSPIAKEEVEGLEGGWAIENERVTYKKGPVINAYSNQFAAQAALEAQQRKHRYPPGTPMLSQDNRTARERETHRRQIQAQRDAAEFQKQIYDNPSLQLAYGTYIGLQEAPGLIAGEMVLYRVSKAYESYKVVRQSYLAQKSGNTFMIVNKLEKSVTNGARLIDDASYVKAPIELSLPKNNKIGNLVDKVFKLKAHHIIEGSEKSVHNWEVLVPDKNPAKIKEIIKMVLEYGKDVPYKRGQAKAMKVVVDGVTREVQVPYFKAADGSVQTFSTAFVK